MHFYDRVSANNVRRTADANHGRYRHGLRDSREYSVWRDMKSRCLNPSHKAYQQYGGRGIQICREWVDDFTVFYGDMGPRPSRRHTLERIDNSLGYCPENCEWREWEQQNRNRRNTVMVSWQGETVPLALVAEKTGLDYGFLWRRIIKFQWSVDDAISKPNRIKGDKR